MTRNVSALAIRCQDSKSWCLVDCGEATQHQLLKTSYSTNHLQAIFITHVHGDHCYGLPGLLASAAMNGRTAPLIVVGPQALKDFLDVTLQATQLYLGYDLQFIAVESLTESVAIAGMDVSRVALSHRVPSYAYCFRLQRRRLQLLTQRLQQQGVTPGPLWGRLQRGEDVITEDGCVLKSADYVQATTTRQSIVVCGDNDTPQRLDCVADVDVIVHEATYDQAALNQGKAGYGHSSAAQIAGYAQSAGVKNLVLTHFSPRYHNATQEAPGLLETEAREHYFGALYFARDFDSYVLQEDGVLQRLGD